MASTSSAVSSAASARNTCMVSLLGLVVSMSNDCVVGWSQWVSLSSRQGHWLDPGEARDAPAPLDRLAIVWTGSARAPYAPADVRRRSHPVARPGYGGLARVSGSGLRGRRQLRARRLVLPNGDLLRA